MNIDNYEILISNLPVRSQSFTTKRETWNTAENKIEWLKKINGKIFRNNPTLTISRQDIFETSDLREKIVKTIYWGYTRGMRGNHVVNILINIDLIENAIKQLRHIVRPTTADYEKLKTTFKTVKGLGLSTYSKLLYFLDITFNDNPCLILDQRLIDVFRSKTYSDFQQLNNIRYDNSEKKYLGYLLLANHLSKKIETNAENIEQFLFIFGKNLKNANITKPIISKMWNGYCPESLIKGKIVRMRLNQQDFFESEETGLQICIIPGVQAVIMNYKGKGKFRINESFGDEIENGEVLSPQNSDGPPFNNPAIAFGGSEEIESYIATIK